MRGVRVPRRNRPISFGDLRRTVPIARNFGFDRGLPVDRVYIEQFLARHSLGIRGSVLEIGGDDYTRKFGAERVTRSDVLHVSADYPKATIVADLTAADHVPSDTFDCIICTQTLQLVYDVPAAVETLYRTLKPGGLLLVTVPGISQIDDAEWAGTWYWSFTPLAARRLFERPFGPERVHVDAGGNVLTALAFLHGLAAEDLEAGEFVPRDPAYPLVVTIAAVKAVQPGTRASDERRTTVSVIIPCYNQAHFLGEAIESALQQSCADTDIQIIVVDDGSCDNTLEVAERYFSVTCLQQVHSGLSAARNAGLTRAHGEFVVFLDADDRLRPRAIVTGLRMLLDRPACAFVSGHHRLIGVDGNVLEEWERSVVEPDRYELLLRGNYIGMCATVVFRRVALDVVGGFDPRLSAAEDYDLYLRVARRFPVCDHAEVVAEYRRHGVALTDDPLRMLGATLAVLRRQTRFVADTPRYRDAWQAGIRHWRDFYGRATAAWLIRRLHDGQRVRSLLADAVALARLAPLEFRGAWRRLVRPVR